MATTAFVIEMIIEDFPNDDLTLGFISSKMRLFNYETVKRTLSRMVARGDLIMIELSGEPNVYAIPKLILPTFDKVLKFALENEPDFGKYLSLRDGGTNTGGGYKYLFSRFYSVLREMQMQ